jgi:hypothetical protein
VVRLPLLIVILDGSCDILSTTLLICTSSIISSRKFDLASLRISSAPCILIYSHRRIPHYHAQEATDAIKPLLQGHYHVDKSSYFGALWTAFTRCQWVEADAGQTAQSVCTTTLNQGRRRFTNTPIQLLHTGPGAHGEKSPQDISSVDEKGVLWYRPGPMPPPAVTMR